ncbi:hypothetical protein V8J88_21990 [Massilia sp. W12]|uniref:hypothetical protein n=1 Tax=Massilia sp. W12 TaxID=3126507 RepID=UPI0030D378E9
MSIAFCKARIYQTPTLIDCFIFKELLPHFRACRKSFCLSAAEKRDYEAIIYCRQAHSRISYFTLRCFYDMASSISLSACAAFMSSCCHVCGEGRTIPSFLPHGKKLMIPGFLLAAFHFGKLLRFIAQEAWRKPIA